MLYELHYQRTPFEDNTKLKVANNILNKEVEFPEPWQENRDKDYKSFNKLLRRLLKKDPKVIFFDPLILPAFMNFLNFSTKDGEQIWCATAFDPHNSPTFRIDFLALRTSSNCDFRNDLDTPNLIEESNRSWDKNSSLYLTSIS